MMKSKLLILGTFLGVFAFSCSDELTDPSSFDAKSMNGFEIRDARLYFEEHATDLSYVHFSEHRIATRGASVESPELILDWEHAVRTANQEAVLVEVPIFSEWSQYSIVRCFNKRNVRLGNMLENRVRLVMARCKDGRTQMFVVTLIPSIKYPNKEQDIENFRYLGGGNFTGKVFCSTLEGHFVEASQYVKGRFIGKLNVMTRQEFVENQDSLAGVYYESISLTSAVKTRSGIYSFNEGDKDTPCPYHPQYTEGNCPFCLDEVIVLACRHCGRILEDGEVCHCMDCQYCHSYPCICTSDCSICRPGPCTKCTKCGRHFCFGYCFSPEGGTGGGTGGSGTGNSGNTGSGDTKEPTTQASGKTTVAKITAATEKAAKAALSKFGLSTPACNFGVKTAFNEIYSSKELDNKRANDMVDYWENNSSKWEAIELKDAQRLANEGWFVVAGWKAETGSGHVIVIVPGKEETGWKGMKIPVCMDTGRNMKNAKQKLSQSFGMSKKDSIKFYKYK